MGKQVFLIVFGLLIVAGFVKAQRLVGFDFSGDSLLQGFEVIQDDPLTSKELTFGETSKLSFQGSFSKKGWQSEHPKGFLKIGLSDFASGEGALQVTLMDLFRDKPNRITANEKRDSLNPIHFINMFSEESGDFLHETSNSKNSCFWSLMFPPENGRSETNDNLQIIWSSKGFKDAPLNRLSERFNLLPENWKWDKNEYTFTVIWSKNQELLKVYVNGLLFYKVDWYGQEQPLRFIYLGKCGVFDSLMGAYFRDLKIFEK